MAAIFWSLLIFAVLGALVAFIIWINRVSFASTADLPIFRKSLFRAVVLTLTCGIGIIGGEGFALPGPLLGALIFYNGPKYYAITAIYPAAAWFLFFFIGHLVASFFSRNKV